MAAEIAHRTGRRKIKSNNNNNNTIISEYEVQLQKKHFIVEKRKNSNVHFSIGDDCIGVWVHLKRLNQSIVNDNDTNNNEGEERKKKRYRSLNGIRWNSKFSHCFGAGLCGCRSRVHWIVCAHLQSYESKVKKERKIKRHAYTHITLISVHIYTFRLNLLLLLPSFVQNILIVQNVTDVFVPGAPGRFIPYIQCAFSVYTFRIGRNKTKSNCIRV